MLIWKNTATLDGFDDGLNFTQSKLEAEIVLMGSKPIDIAEFPNLKGIFRAGIGRDSVPQKEAKKKSIIIRYPSDKTINIIYEETANFTCGIIFRMLYQNLGTIDPWIKTPREQFSNKTLLVIGTGRIGRRVSELMSNFMCITTFDIMQNKDSELKGLITKADCVTIHIPKSNKNLSFIDAEKLSWMKSGGVLINTARGAIVDEEALYIELQSHRLKAAFDVYWEEPYKGKLKEFHPDSFYMTPHVASTCIGFLKGCRNDIIELIEDINNDFKN